MLKVKTLIRTRTFTLAPKFKILYSTHLFSSASLSSHLHLTSSPLHATDITFSFREWFKLRKNRSIDCIFSILSSQEEDDLAIDLAMSRLDLHLDEKFVLDVLNYGGDVLSTLKFFHWAGRQEHFYHSPATFHAIFKVMSKAKLMSSMLSFLENNVKQMLVYHSRFNNVLVMGYAVAGKIEVALHLFGKMRFQGLDLDGFTYHVLLNALVEESYFEAVGIVSKQISLRGHVSSYTNSIMVKSLCKQDRLEEGEDLIRGLVRDGRNFTGHMMAHLVEGLCKNKKFRKAGKLVEEFRDLGMVQMDRCYAVWIKNLVQVGNVDVALEFLQNKMALEGYVPDVIHYNNLIFGLLIENRLEEVCDLLMEMMEGYVVPNKLTMNAALCFFCKAGMVDVALELYNSRSEVGLSPNSMAYKYLINTLMGDGNINEACIVLKNSILHGYFPDGKTFSVIADALCRERKLDKMKDLVIVSLEQNFIPRFSLYDKFISALCGAKMVEDGYVIHGELNKINKVASKTTYINLINGFQELNRGDVAVKLLIEMQEKGYRPPRKLFISVIECVCYMENPLKQILNLLEMQLSRWGHSCNAYNTLIDGTGHAKKSELARHVYEMMLRSGLEPNVCSEILMLQSYLKNDRIADAVNFFEDLSKRGKVGRKLYNAMIVGLCKANMKELALSYLSKMKVKVIPSFECYEEIMLLLCSNGEYDKVINLMVEWHKGKNHMSSFMGNILLLHSLKNTNLLKAWACSNPNMCLKVRMLGRIIDLFSDSRRLNLHIEDLEKAIEQCFPLDIFTYNMVLRKLTIGEMNVARAVFNRLCMKGYVPNKWTYNTLASGFFRHGMVAEAHRWLEEMYRKGFLPFERTKLSI